MSKLRIECGSDIQCSMLRHEVHTENIHFKTFSLIYILIIIWNLKSCENNTGFFAFSHIRMIGFLGWVRFKECPAMLENWPVRLETPAGARKRCKTTVKICRKKTHLQIPPMILNLWFDARKSEYNEKLYYW